MLRRMTAMLMTRRQSVVQAIKTYGTQLFGFIRSRVSTKEDAEDILQDIWYQLSNQPEEETIESLSGWLYTAARNKITDSYRKKKDRSLDEYRLADDSVEFNLKEILIATAETPESVQMREFFWEELFAALSELPESQRMVFISNELEEMTLQEIADQQNEKLKTIISRKRYAVQFLRERLEDIYNDIIYS